MKKDLRLQVVNSEIKPYGAINNEPLKKKSNNDIKQRINSPSMS